MQIKVMYGDDGSPANRIRCSIVQAQLLTRPALDLEAALLETNGNAVQALMPSPQSVSPLRRFPVDGSRTSAANRQARLRRRRGSRRTTPNGRVPSRPRLAAPWSSPVRARPRSPPPRSTTACSNASSSRQLVVGGSVGRVHRDAARRRARSIVPWHGACRLVPTQDDPLCA